MNQLISISDLSFSSTQDSSLSTQTEPCRACEKFGQVVNCELHDLRPAMYFHLGGAFFSPNQPKVYTSCSASENKLLWHANILGENPTFVFQIIKNLVRYSQDYICEEYAEHVENRLENCDVHVSRERRFICDIIESLQKDKADGMLELLKNYKGKDQKDLFRIYTKDIRYVRLFSLLSMIFLKKSTEGQQGFYVEELGPPVLLSRESSLIEDEGCFFSSQRPPAVALSRESSLTEHKVTFFSSQQLLEYTSDSLSSLVSDNSQKSNDTIRVHKPMPSNYPYDDNDEFDEPAVKDKEPQPIFSPRTCISKREVEECSRCDYYYYDD